MVDLFFNSATFLFLLQLDVLSLRDAPGLEGHLKFQLLIK
jgi:hypothetical protein